MTQETVNLKISFESLVNAIASLGLEEKRKRKSLLLYCFVIGIGKMSIEAEQSDRIRSLCKKILQFSKKR